VFVDSVLYRIPPMLDFDMILSDLHSVGWVDQKLDTFLGFGNGYVRQLRTGQIKKISLVAASRIHNLWADEMERCERALTRTAAAK
jgi:hypothetical protein